MKQYLKLKQGDVLENLMIFEATRTWEASSKALAEEKMVTLDVWDYLITDKTKSIMW